MDSCIYEGRVRHTRTLPRKHRFSYRLFMMYLDLDELPTLFDRYWLWSVSRPALARFRREHHLGDTRQSLKESSNGWFARRPARFRPVPSGC